MNDTTRWAVDGALAGLGPGLVLAALLSEGLLLLPPVAVAVALQDPEAMWDYVGVFLLLTAGIGALVGWGVLGTYQLRRVVPATVAPAMFALVGWGAGLLVTGLWLGGIADWGSCGGCVCIEESPAPERVGMAVAAAWTLGTAAWAPVFGVLSLTARTGAERARAVVATWGVAWLVMPVAYILGGLLA